jgi:hypothetical protein
VVLRYRAKKWIPENKNDTNYGTRVNKTDTFNFPSVNITSFARITSPIDMYLLTFLGSYATRNTVVFEKIRTQSRLGSTRICNLVQRQKTYPHHPAQWPHNPCLKVQKSTYETCKGEWCTELKPRGCDFGGAQLFLLDSFDSYHSLNFFRTPKISYS